MNKRVVVIFSFLIITIGLQAQEMFNLDAFNAIKSYGKIEVRLVEADKNYLKINNGNLADLELSYSIKKNTLHVKTTKAVPSGKRVKVEVGFTTLHHVLVGGGVLLYNRDTLDVMNLSIDSKSGSEVDIVVKCDSIACKVNKGAFMRLQGKSRVVSLKTSTGGDYRATELSVNSMYARMNGGSAEVDVVDYLNAKVRMKGRLEYRKAPKKIDKVGESIGELEDF